MTILAEGRSREGDHWQLVLDQVDEDNQVTSIRVVSPEGRTSQGGYGDRSVRPGQRIAWYGGWDDEGGPNRAIVRVSQVAEADHGMPRRPR